MRNFQQAKEEIEKVAESYGKKETLHIYETENPYSSVHLTMLNPNGWQVSLWWFSMDEKLQVHHENRRTKDQKSFKTLWGAARELANLMKSFGGEDEKL